MQQAKRWRSEASETWICEEWKGSVVLIVINEDMPMNVVWVMFWRLRFSLCVDIVCPIYLHSIIIIIKAWCPTIWNYRRKNEGKPARGRRRLQMLYKLTKGDDYVALKQAAEVRKWWRYSGMMLETCSTAEDKCVMLSAKDKFFANKHDMSG